MEPPVRSFSMAATAILAILTVVSASPSRHQLTNRGLSAVVFRPPMAEVPVLRQEELKGIGLLGFLSGVDAGSNALKGPTADSASIENADSQGPPTAEGMKFDSAVNAAIAQSIEANGTNGVNGKVGGEAAAGKENEEKLAMQTGLGAAGIGMSIGPAMGIKESVGVGIEAGTGTGAGDGIGMAMDTGSDKGIGKDTQTRTENGIKLEAGVGAKTENDNKIKTGVGIGIGPQTGIRVEIGSVTKQNTENKTNEGAGTLATEEEALKKPISASNHEDSLEHLIVSSSELASLSDEGVVPVKELQEALKRGQTPAGGLKAPPQRTNLQCTPGGAGSFGCCAPFTLPQIGFNQIVCVNLTLHPETASATLNLLVNGNSLVETSVSANNPAPLCIPFPPFPPLAFCVRFYGLGLVAGGLRVCISLEAQLGGVPLLVVRFDCVRVGAGGVTVEPRPPEVPFVSIGPPGGPSIGLPLAPASGTGAGADKILTTHDGGAAIVSSETTAGHMGATTSGRFASIAHPRTTSSMGHSRTASIPPITLSSTIVNYPDHTFGLDSESAIRGFDITRPPSGRLDSLKPTVIDGHSVKLLIPAVDMKSTQNVSHNDHKNVDHISLNVNINSHYPNMDVKSHYPSKYSPEMSDGSSVVSSSRLYNNDPIVSLWTPRKLNEESDVMISSEERSRVSVRDKDFTTHVKLSSSSSKGSAGFIGRHSPHILNKVAEEGRVRRSLFLPSFQSRHHLSDRKDGNSELSPLKGLSEGGQLSPKEYTELFQLPFKTLESLVSPIKNFNLPGSNKELSSTYKSRSKRSSDKSFVSDKSLVPHFSSKHANIFPPSSHKDNVKPSSVDRVFGDIQISPGTKSKSSPINEVSAFPDIVPPVNNMYADTLSSTGGIILTNENVYIQPVDQQQLELAVASPPRAISAQSKQFSMDKVTPSNLIILHTSSTDKNVLSHDSSSTSPNVSMLLPHASETDSSVNNLEHENNKTSYNNNSLFSFDSSPDYEMKPAVSNGYFDNLNEEGEMDFPGFNDLSAYPINLISSLISKTRDAALRSTSFISQLLTGSSSDSVNAIDEAKGYSAVGDGETGIRIAPFSNYHENKAASKVVTHESESNRFGQFPSFKNGAFIRSSNGKMQSVSEADMAPHADEKQSKIRWIV